MNLRTNMNLFALVQDYSESCTTGISEHDIAVLRSKTGQPAIAIRRAAMKVGSDLKKIERELTAQKMDRS